MHFLCQPVCFRLTLQCHQNQKANANYKTQVNKSTRRSTFWQITLLAWILPLSAMGRNWMPQWHLGNGRIKHF